MASPPPSVVGRAEQVWTKACQLYSLFRVGENVSPSGLWPPEQALHFLYSWVPLDGADGAGTGLKEGSSKVCPQT